MTNSGPLSSVGLPTNRVRLAFGELDIAEMSWVYPTASASSLFNSVSIDNSARVAPKVES